jgi:ABC-type hemin transport system ATPase subunit
LGEFLVYPEAVVSLLDQVGKFLVFLHYVVWGMDLAIWAEQAALRITKMDGSVGVQAVVLHDLNLAGMFLVFLHYVVWGMDIVTKVDGSVGVQVVVLHNLNLAGMFLAFLQAHCALQDWVALALAVQTS